MEIRTEKIPFEPETGHAGAGKSCLFIMAKAYTLYGAPKVFLPVGHEGVYNS